MKFVSVDNLESGMIVVRSVFNEEGVMLLARNSKLSPRLIKRVRELGYSGLYIYDEFSDYEELNEVLDEVERMSIVRSLKTLDLDKVMYFSNMIVDRLLGMEELVLDFKELRNFHSSTYEHSINVALSAAACGINMGMKNDELNDLALAALLHDVGKRKIPLSILDKAGKLTPEEREEVEKHTIYGYEILRYNEKISTSVRVAVLEHHENYDGSGYPEGRKGNDIYLDARVIHVADVYDALRQKRAYKNDFGGMEALEYLWGFAGTMFDFDIVQEFMKSIVIYPVGAEITLSDGRKARILKNNPDYLLRPVVMTEDMKRIDLANDMDSLSLVISGSATSEKGKQQ